MNVLTIPQRKMDHCRVFPDFYGIDHQEPLVKIWRRAALRTSAVGECGNTESGNHRENTRVILLTQGLRWENCKSRQ
jgi:hypothetical protein